MSIEFVVNGVTVPDGGSAALPARTVASVPAETITIRAVTGSNITVIRDTDVLGQSIAGFFMRLDSVPALPINLAPAATTTVDVKTSGRVLEAVPDLGHFFMRIEVEYDDGSPKTASLDLRQTVSDPAFTPPSLTKTELYRDTLWGYFNPGGHSGEFNLDVEIVAGGHIRYIQEVVEPYVDWVGEPCRVMLWSVFGNAGNEDHGGDIPIDAYLFSQAQASDSILWDTWGQAVAAMDALANLGSLHIYFGTDIHSATMLGQLAASDYAGFVTRWLGAIRPYLLPKALDSLGFDAINDPAKIAGEGRRELDNAMRRVLAARGVDVFAEAIQQDHTEWSPANGWGQWSEVRWYQYRNPDWRFDGGPFSYLSDVALQSGRVILLMQAPPSLLAHAARQIANAIALGELASHPIGFEPAYPIQTLSGSGVTSDQLHAEVNVALGELG